ncbi:MAG: hypothetical protein ACK559_35500, partial [bacterium]
SRSGSPLRSASWRRAGRVCAFLAPSTASNRRCGQSSDSRSASPRRPRWRDDWRCVTACR